MLAAEAGLEVIHPSAKLRGRLDSKIVTTKIGNTRARPQRAQRARLCRGSTTTSESSPDDAGLGDQLVVQTPYGDSGRTTYFINSSADWDKHSEAMADQQLKVMKRIRPLEVCVEAVITEVRNAGWSIRCLARGLPRADAVRGRLVR